MSQAFVIVLREGFEAFLIVSIIVAYLNKVGLKWLLPSVGWGIVVSLVASAGLGFWMAQGVNEPLWEAVLGFVAAIMVTTLVIQMWFQGRFMKSQMEQKISKIAEGPSRRAIQVGVFFFTVFMIAREGMETALMLIQVPRHDVILGTAAGVLATAFFAWLWVRFSSFVNVKLFFQVTGIFLLLFVAQILIYSFHELSEAGLMPNAEAFHIATEPFSPDGLYGRWFSVVTVGVSAAWLIAAWAQKQFFGVDAKKSAIIVEAKGDTHAFQKDTRRA